MPKGGKKGGGAETSKLMKRRSASYEELQELVIEKLKLPVYVRKMREAGEKGPRFLR